MFGIDDIYWIAINSVLSFVFLFIISKILGKKQIAQLEFIDYAVGISLGSIAAEWAIDLDQPFYHYALSMGIFFLLALTVALVGRKNTFLKRVFKGKPVALIYEGKISYAGLKKCKIDVNDLLSMLREKNYFDVEDVAYALFETSGKLSVLPKGGKRPIVIEDLEEGKATAAGLTNVLIVDGVVSYSGLNELNKNSDWLFAQLDAKNVRLNEVLLATYDEAKNELRLHEKD